MQACGVQVSAGNAVAPGGAQAGLKAGPKFGYDRTAFSQVLVREAGVAAEADVAPAAGAASGAAEAAGSQKPGSGAQALLAPGLRKALTRESESAAAPSGSAKEAQDSGAARAVISATSRGLPQGASSSSSSVELQAEISPQAGSKATAAEKLAGMQAAPHAGNAEKSDDTTVTGETGKKKATDQASGGLEHHKKADRGRVAGAAGSGAPVQPQVAASLQSSSATGTAVAGAVPVPVSEAAPTMTETKQGSVRGKSRPPELSVSAQATASATSDPAMQDGQKAASEALSPDPREMVSAMGPARIAKNALHSGALSAHTSDSGNAAPASKAPHPAGQSVRQTAGFGASPVSARQGDAGLLSVDPAHSKSSFAMSSGTSNGSSNPLAAAVPVLHIAGSGSVQLPAAAPTVAAAMHPGAAFDRIDSAPSPSVLGSTPHQLSVGVQDPGLGWVEIHTHTTGGQVAAVVATSSAAAHSAVTGHLPDMRNYLAGQQVRVDHLSSQSFSSPQGGGGGSPREQSQQRGGHGVPVQTRVSLPVAAGGAAETESLSYISIRV